MYSISRIPLRNGQQVQVQEVSHEPQQYSHKMAMGQPTWPPWEEEEEGEEDQALYKAPFKVYTRLHQQRGGGLGEGGGEEKEPAF